MSILYVVSKNEKHLLLEYKKSNPFLNFDIILDDELRSSFYGVLNNSAITYLKNLGFSYFNAEKIANTTLLLKDLDFYRLFICAASETNLMETIKKVIG